MNHICLFLTLFSLWREKRNLPEHQGESALEFYMWRVVLLIGYMVIIVTALALLVAFMVAANHWPYTLVASRPYLSLFAVGFMFLLVVCLCGFIILRFILRFEALVLRIELRKRRSLPKAT